ncbi:MAG: HAMP domain-containing sensor histidine kinase [Acidobacteriaceae bacterium]
MSLPIRIRLSISYFLIFACACALLVGAAWWMARRSLLFELDQEMQEHIDDVHDFVVANDLGADEARTRAAIYAEFSRQDEGKWLQIEEGQGNWIYRPWRMLLSPQSLPPAAFLPAHGDFIEFPAGRHTVRALRRAFTVNGRVWVVESGITLTKTDAVLNRFRDDLLLIAPLVLLMAGFAGHLLSRRALDPVAAIACEAQRIHEGNLQTRLPSLETGDELAHLSRTLNDMLERIESSVRSVRDFTAHASHELRTPVALIRSEAELALCFDRTPGQYRETLEEIGAEARQMSSLLDSLLFLARVDAGTEEAQLEPADAHHICSIAARKWRPVFSEAGIEFSVELPSGLLTVMADRLYLPRLLNIVLENAGKYTPPGGAVRLSLTADGERAHFEVADTGVGIPRQDQAQIFDRFYRAASVRAARIPGSGLGLSLAAWIAARHQTKIDVVSELGAGSSFSWTLPLQFPGAESLTAKGPESVAAQECRTTVV